MSMSRRLSKKLSMRVMRLKEAYPTAKVELWCEDEHRLGLKPVIRKVWSPIGHRPQVKVHQRYEWTYLYAFAHPKNRRSSLAGSADRKRGGLLLSSGALWQGGWSFHQKAHHPRARSSRMAHPAKNKLEVPEGIHLEFLPSHSPELQPSERLWPLSNEGIANRHFEEIEELEEALVERCVALCEQPELIRSYLRYHWWPNAA
jgi:transposase